MQIIYLNHKFLPVTKAKISVMDRGFLFGDGVFELITMYQGKPFRLIEHLKRLQRSLDSVYIDYRVDPVTLEKIILKLVKLNQATKNYCTIYIQVTRGENTERSYRFEVKQNPTLLILLQKFHLPEYAELKKGKSAITLPDIRWKLCHIKTTSLMASVLLYSKVKTANAEEGILIRNNYAIEGISSNVYIVKKHTIITPPLSKNILSGITRDFILSAARTLDITVMERNLKKQELFSADEVWISSSGRGVFPITKLDNRKVGSSKPGPIWEKIAKMVLASLKSGKF